MPPPQAPYQAYSAEVGLIDWAKRPLYAITPGSAGLALNRQRRLNSISESICEILSVWPRRVGAIQLREQVGSDALTDDELRTLVCSISQVTQISETALLINRAIHLACELKLGVHVGYPLTSITQAREAGVSLVAYSAHSFEEARSAFDLGASFVTLGPVFQPMSKPGYKGDILGSNGLRAACIALGPDSPVIGLGGITEDNVDEIRHSGASGFGCIGAVFAAESKSGAVTRLLERWDGCEERTPL